MLPTSAVNLAFRLEQAGHVASPALQQTGKHSPTCSAVHADGHMRSLPLLLASHISITLPPHPRVFSSGLPVSSFPQQGWLPRKCACKDGLREGGARAGDFPPKASAAACLDVPSCNLTAPFRHLGGAEGVVGLRGRTLKINALHRQTQAKLFKPTNESLIV